MINCECGHGIDGPDEHTEHFLDAFVLTDDIGVDGRVHAEARRDPFRATGASPSTQLSYACLCGHVAEGMASLDEHLLHVFVPADGIGLDGKKHDPAATVSVSR